MRDYITKLIQNKINRYKADYNEMLGDFRGELETIRGYNGRQILELLQNCDDEGSLEVVITLDSEKNIISITNDGAAFSKDGYLSLFIPHLSSKHSKRKYIGNKGLGFRSIINWADRIEIHSNNLAVIYSEENKKNAYDRLFNKEQQAEIRSKRKLKESVIPMPFLAMPEISEIEHNDFVTKIIIHYKTEFRDKIFEQVDGITTETILFLRHIERIRFEGFADKEDIYCKKTVVSEKTGVISPTQQIQYSDLNWDVFVCEDDLPSYLSDSENEEKEFYQIKIAVEKNLKKSSPFLYSFFPTRIRLKQPYILHATFDLDSTRNQVVESEKNRYILYKVVEFTIAVAKYYTQARVSYRPLEILNFAHKADTLEGLGYYDLIGKAIQTERIFPCIDNQYRTLSEVIYLSDDFGQFLKVIGASNMMMWHILPISSSFMKNNILDLGVNRHLLNAGVGPELLNQIAALNLSYAQRAKLIYLILEHAGYVALNYSNKLNILVNENDKIIPGEEFIYTPVSQDKLLRTPSFTKIQFINKHLFNELVKVFDYHETENAGKSRFIYDKLTGFCNIHSYEPATLAEKIAREANIAIERNGQEKIKIIKETHACLYYNFTQLSNKASIPTLRVNIFCITKDNRAKPANELVLSGFYPRGNIIQSIFSEIYTEADYVGSPNMLGINEYDIQVVEEYLLWINVNRFAIYKEITTSYETNDYSRHILKLNKISNSTNYNFKGKKIVELPKILSRISLNKLLVWVFYDEQLKKQINDNSNDDEFRNYYRTFSTIYNKPSFIKFQIKTIFRVKFENILLDERYSWSNDVVIDYTASIFRDNGITKSSINEILVSLGAKDEFKDLSISRVAQIINKVPDIFKDGKTSQTIYKSALAHYQIHKTVIPVSIKLFAHTSNGLEAIDSKKIFFSDRIKLPARLKKDFPVFNFPSRAGGSDAIMFFGINDLKSVSIEIVNYTELTDLTTDFKDYFELLKPCLLAIRINKVEELVQRKLFANICEKISLVFCTYICYSVNEKKYEAVDYEFVQLKEQTYLIKIPNTETLETLRKSGSLTESFADIVSLSFDVTGEKAEYRHLLRWDFKEVMSNIQSDFGEDTVKLARELLGQADYKTSFWKAVFDAKGLEYSDSWSDFQIEEHIGRCFGIICKIPLINYDQLNTETELFKIKELFARFKLELAEFMKYYPYQISMESYHNGQLKNSILTRKNFVKTALWEIYEKKDIESQSRFLSEINRFEDYFEFANKAAALHKHNFDLPTDQLVTDFISQLYGNLTTSPNIDLEIIRQESLKKFKADERFKISQDEVLKSLVYFPQNIEYIRNFIAELENEQFVDNTMTQHETNIPVRIISSDKLVSSIVPVGIHNKKKGVFTPKEKNEKKNKVKGITSEEVVFNFMKGKKEFQNVDLVSHDNEGLHYDIRYTNEKGVVKYVEVKSFDSDYFFLSSAQFQFGLKNTDDYEVWLVQNESRIIPIKDLFTNTKYKPVIKDYIIYLHLDQS